MTAAQEKDIRQMHWRSLIDMQCADNGHVIDEMKRTASDKLEDYINSLKG